MILVVFYKWSFTLMILWFYRRSFKPAKYVLLFLSPEISSVKQPEKWGSWMPPGEWEESWNAPQEPDSSCMKVWADYFNPSPPMAEGSISEFTACSYPCRTTFTSCLLLHTEHFSCASLREWYPQIHTGGANSRYSSISWWSKHIYKYIYITIFICI